MKHKRLISGIFLAVILVSLILYSGLEYNNYDPSIEYILENFETYNNAKISFMGEIVEINKTSQKLTLRFTKRLY